MDKKDTSFINELPYAHVVVVAFRNPENRLELSVWGYQKQEDCEQKFNEIIEVHKSTGESSPLIACQCFMIGLYENFGQSQFMQLGDLEGKVM